MYIEKQRLFSKTPEGPQKNIASAPNYQDPYTPQKYQSKLPFNSTLRIDSIRKNRRSAVGGFWSSGVLIPTSNKSYGSYPSNNIVRKSHGSPRFPNIHKPLLEFDSDKYICDDLLSTDCEERTAEFKELLLKEFHRVLMGESKVFKSGLDAHNTYDVKYDSNNRKDRSRQDVMCALKSVKLRTVTVSDEPFASLGYRIPRAPLQQGRHYNTCAVVTSAGALLGSRLGEFIGKLFIEIMSKQGLLTNTIETVSNVA